MPALLTKSSLIPKLFTLALTSSLLFACKPATEDPGMVAEKYWQAMKTGDTETARALVSTNSQQAFNAYTNQPEENKISIDDVTLGTEHTSINTVLHPAGDPGKNSDDHRTFDTILVLEDGQWKIDAERTVIPPPKTPEQKELDELAEQLTESMQESLDTMDDAMSEGMKFLNDALREGSKEMGESLLDQMDELKKSMRDSIEEMKKQRQQKQSKPKGDGEGMI